MGSSMVQGMLWGAAANDWAELQEPTYLPLWTAMLDSVGVKAGMSIFDAGCGAGGLSALAAKRGAKVSGIDAADQMIALAKKAVPGGDFRVGDLEELPFAGQTYQMVFAANSVQYCTSPVSAVRELKRVCKANGRVVVGVWGRPQDCHMYDIMEAIAQVVPGGSPKDGPFAFSEPDELENLMMNAGLVVMSTKGVECPHTYPDIDTFWRAMSSTGPVQRAIQIVDLEKIQDAVMEAVRRYIKPDGTIKMENRFRYAVTSITP